MAHRAGKRIKANLVRQGLWNVVWEPRKPLPMENLIFNWSKLVKSVIQSVWRVIKGLSSNTLRAFVQQNL